MAYYYRKPINKVANDVKLKMQLGALTLKLSENNNKIDNLLEVDKNIKKDIADNSNLINSNKKVIEDKISKLDRNLILFNGNLTNFIDSTKNDINDINLSINKIPNIENNITKNHLVTQVNKGKTEFNLKLIDNHTNNIKSLNSTLTDIKNDIDRIDSNIYVPMSKYNIENIYFYKLDSIKEFNFLADTKKFLVHEIIINDDLRKDG